MKRVALLGSSALRTGAFLALAAVAATPAFAQAASGAAQATDTAEDEGNQAIVVTGSRIRRPNLESTVPITSLVGEDFFQRGENNVGETLNALPQLRSTFAQQNPGTGIGIAGLNLLDLRGLGTSRTLVLVNGRRHVASDITNFAVSPDVNTIPSDLIQRVDIITGGNSAIYGSDAIAGVVNFILRRDFQGLQVRGIASMPAGGYGANFYTSAMYGMNFGGDRGNVTVHGEYYRQDRIYGSDLDWARTVNGYTTATDTDPTGSDGVPDRVFLRDIRPAAGVYTTGFIPISYQAGNAQCGIGVGSGAGGSGGVPYNCNYFFTPEGRLVQQTGTRVGTGVTGAYLGGNGPTGREGRLLSVYPFSERYNFNLLAHYEFDEALEAFVEAKFVRNNTRGNNTGPSFINGGFSQFDSRERIRLDNPFLNPADRTTLTNLILASGCNTSTQQSCTTARSATGGPLNDADRAAIANGSYRFLLGRTLTDVGYRNENFQRDTFRIVGGLRGTFNDDWNYELSANYGRQTENLDIVGFLDRQRFMLSLDAGRDPATGQIRCRAQFDPTAAVPFQSTALNAQQNAFIASRLQSDIAACVPYNPFGSADNSAAVAYFSTNSQTQTEIEQVVISGFIGGDTSQLFELPGGPVRFALGGEYRRDSVLYEQDPFILTGASNNVVIPLFDASTDAKEAFAEVQIPVLADMPFFHELTLSGAARVASYGGSVGTVWAYNAGLDWAPVRDVRFRGNYSRAVRAPNLAETAFPRVPNFFNGFQDPCREASIGTGTQFRRANCQEDLGALLGSIAALGNQSLPVISGSNPDLEAETSDSWTLGVVLQPRFIPGLSLSIDYYDITVNNVIVSQTAQAIANACYDSPTLQNPFCSAFQRYRGTGSGPGGELPGQILNNSLIQAGVNYAKRTRRGIDINANYRTSLSEDVSLNTGLIYSHGFENNNYQSTVDPDFANRLLGELGDPVDEFRWNVDLTYRNFTFGYQMHYIGPMWINNYEDFNEFQGRPPQDADFADVQKFPATFYHDIRMEWDVSDAQNVSNDLNFYLGVDNVLDTNPPLGLLGTGAGPNGVGNAGIYDVRGRTFYAGFRARF